MAERHGRVTGQLRFLGLPILAAALWCVGTAALPRDNLRPSTPSPSDARSLGHSGATETPSPTPCGPLGVSIIDSESVISVTNVLKDLAAIGPNDIWAVGFTGGPPDATSQTLIEHWNGVNWSIVSSPNAGTEYNYLFGVAAVGPRDLWAVGASKDVGSDSHPLIEHWDGVRWTIVPNPDVGQGTSRLNDVSAIAPGDVWAVGGRDNLSTVLIEHWDGTQWSVVSMPQRPEMFAIAALDPNDIWVVGYGTLHWDGYHWSAIPVPVLKAHLEAISVLGTDDIWAVGSQWLICGVGCNFNASLMVHWDGTAWSQRDYCPFGNCFAVRDAYLHAVAAISHNDVWAAGNDAQHFYLVHWNGTEWGLVPSPLNNYHIVYGAVGISSSDIWFSGQAWDDTSGRYGTLTAEYGLLPLFSDVPVDHPFYRYIRPLACRGVISGYGDGTFRPGNLTTRAQLAKIVVLAEGWPLYSPPTPTFQDVPSTDTFYTYIETAYQQGIISGYDCGPGCLQYRPGNNITRAQLCKIIVLAQGWPIKPPDTPTFRDVSSTDPFYGFIETAYAHSIISGYNCGVDCLEFRPVNNATRGQICKIVFLATSSP